MYKPKKFRIKDKPVIGGIAGQEHDKGDIVYEAVVHDYGLARDDSMVTGILHVSVTLEENGGYPTFTVPAHYLEETHD